MNIQDLEKHAKALAPVLRGFVEKAMAPLIKRVEALEAQTKTVEVEQIKTILDERVNTWALEFERIAYARLEKAIDSMPAPIDGRDGLELKDFQVELSGRSLTFKYSTEGGDIERSVELAVPAYTGVYKQDESYSQGDFVTHNGSLWHCNGKTTEKPGNSKDWTLAVKKGRDGKVEGAN